MSEFSFKAGSRLVCADLLACPFCKGVNTAIQPVSPARVRVGCFTCNAFGPPAESESEAKELWNAASGWQATASARYILEDVPAESMSAISGLPLGVITAAYRNIFETNGPRQEP